MPSNIEDHQHHHHHHLHTRRQLPYQPPLPQQQCCFQCRTMIGPLLLAASDDDDDDDNDDDNDDDDELKDPQSKPRYCDHCMIGKKVKVFWPVDESWYTGVVLEFNSTTNEHLLQYHDEDTEWVKIGDLSHQQQPQPTAVSIGSTREIDTHILPSERQPQGRRHLKQSLHHQQQQDTEHHPASLNHSNHDDVTESNDEAAAHLLDTSQQIHDHDDVDDTAANGDATDALMAAAVAITNSNNNNTHAVSMPTPKSVSSSKSASPYPYIPPSLSSMYGLVPATAAGAVVGSIGIGGGGDNNSMLQQLPYITGGGPPPPHHQQQQQYIPYHHSSMPPQYGGGGGGMSGPPPLHLTMTTGGHLQPPPPPPYGNMMMPPSSYMYNDPTIMGVGGGGGGMQQQQPQPPPDSMHHPAMMMMMMGPGGSTMGSEMMILDYPPQLPPPGGNDTAAAMMHPNYHQHQQQYHYPMMTNSNSHPISHMNSNDGNSLNDNHNTNGNSNSRSRKSGPKPWTKEEDNLLLTLVHTMQWPMKWTVVAQSLPDRTGKQCRERYVNHLNPRLKNSDWATIEDATIFHLYNTIGSHWAKMSKIIPGRTDNGIKNRFHNIRRQYEREDTHRLRLSSVNEYMEEVRHDRLRNFPDHMSGKTLSLWDMKCGIGIMAAQSIISGSSSCNTTSSGLSTMSLNRTFNVPTIGNANIIMNSGGTTNPTPIGGPSSNSSNNTRFGPFRTVTTTTTGKIGSESKTNDDAPLNDDKEDIYLDYHTEICVRCGLIVPSIHTGNEICTKTGWCISCVFIPPSVCSNLLRETLNLRRCANNNSSTHSSKEQTNVISSSTTTTTTIIPTMTTTTTTSVTTSIEEVKELRSIIESFEELFHPINEADAWPYHTTTTTSSTTLSAAGNSTEAISPAATTTTTEVAIVDTTKRSSTSTGSSGR